MLQDEPGIIPRLCVELFQRMSDVSSKGNEVYSVCIHHRQCGGAQRFDAAPIPRVVIPKFQIFDKSTGINYLSCEVTGFCFEFDLLGLLEKCHLMYCGTFLCYKGVLGLGEGIRL